MFAYYKGEVNSSPNYSVYVKQGTSYSSGAIKYRVFLKSKGSNKAYGGQNLTFRHEPVFGDSKRKNGDYILATTSVKTDSTSRLRPALEPEMRPLFVHFISANPILWFYSVPPGYFSDITLIWGTSWILRTNLLSHFNVEWLSIVDRFTAKCLQM